MAPRRIPPAPEPSGEYKYRISKLYQDWREVKAELGVRADNLDEHRVLTLVDCDVDYCDDPDCEYCGGEPVEIDDDEVEGPDDDHPYHPSISLMSTGFHYVNRAGYYIIDPPWQDDDVDDGGNIPDELVDFSGLTATELLESRRDDGAPESGSAVRRTERERLARKREYKRFAGLKKITVKEVAEAPGRFRELAGWCAEVERSRFDRASYEIVELDDGPYAFCPECAAMIRAQIAEINAKGKLPSA